MAEFKRPVREQCRAIATSTGVRCLKRYDVSKATACPAHSRSGGAPATPPTGAAPSAPRDTRATRSTRAGAAKRAAETPARKRRIVITGGRLGGFTEEEPTAAEALTETVVDFSGPGSYQKGFEVRPDTPGAPAYWTIVGPQAEVTGVPRNNGANTRAAVTNRVLLTGHLHTRAAPGYGHMNAYEGQICVQSMRYL